ncbi:MAG: DegT/DnrJ/EryC1/StrS family aminotransferase, partial [Deltaproteobacteria bacterium]|nr:DegT/DnrJ/EryC1/StrS family aminotransferase [Deltaproteobacteria bacterium]
MKVPLLDLKKQYAQIREEVWRATEEVFESQHFILGPKVEKLEEEIAGYCSSPYAVGVSSGTDALLISLMAAGVGSGDYVVTTPYSFFATLGSIVRLGAIPIIVDIDPDTYNIAPEKVKGVIDSLDKKTRARLKAIIPVHLYGQCADMEPIIEISREHGLIVIEDAAQAIGAEYRFSNGEVKRAGSMGDFGCFSFFPSKNLGAFGDGGMVTTSRESFFERLKILRVHGGKPKYYHKVIGGNFRLDALQAAILLVKIKYLNKWTEQRIKNADTYRKLFEESGLDLVELPLEKGERHIYNQFVIRVPERRDDLRAFLRDQGIGTEVYYPV